MATASSMKAVSPVLAPTFPQILERQCDSRLHLHLTTQRSQDPLDVAVPAFLVFPEAMGFLAWVEAELLAEQLVLFLLVTIGGLERV